MSNIPQSREVRLQSGITENPIEDFLFKAHTGPTSELSSLITQAEVYVHGQRSCAAEQLGKLLIDRLFLEGYLSRSAIREIIESWHEEEAA